MYDDYTCIGTATRGMTIDAPIYLSRDDRRRHLHLLGKTGTGKTTAIRALVFDDLAQNRDFALLDPLGHLAESIVDAVPAECNDRVIYFDPSDAAHVPAFNPLYAVPKTERHLVADQILEAFLRVWGASLEDAPRLAYILYNGVRLLLDAPSTTLLGLPRLLIDDDYRTRLLHHCSDPVVRHYWQGEFASYDDRFRVQVISPVQNKIGMLLSPPALRNIIGQPRSTINITRLMNEGGILLANLAKGKLGSTTSHLLGAFLTTTIAHVAQSRIARPAHEWRDFTLYADEVQNVATDSFAFALSESRNWNLMIVTANQFMAQLPESMQKALIANCGSFVIFRVGSHDSALMAKEFGLENASTLSETPNFHAWVRLLENGNPTDPFIMKTLVPEAPAQGRKSAVVAHTRARHTRAIEKVERSIHAQLGA